MKSQQHRQRPYEVSEEQEEQINKEAAALAKKICAELATASHPLVAAGAMTVALDRLHSIMGPRLWTFIDSFRASLENEDKS